MTEVPSGSHPRDGTRAAVNSSSGDRVHTLGSGALMAVGVAVFPVATARLFWKGARDTR